MSNTLTFLTQTLWIKVILFLLINQFLLRIKDYNLNKNILCIKKSEFQERV